MIRQLALASLLSTASIAEKATAPPNVLFLFTDDQ